MLLVFVSVTWLPWIWIVPFFLANAQTCAVFFIVQVRGGRGAGGNAPPLGSVAGLPVQSRLAAEQQHQQHCHHHQEAVQAEHPDHDHQQQQQQQQQQGSQCTAWQPSHPRPPPGASLLAPDEPIAIAGLEHCYGLGGPTPLGPAGVGNMQRTQAVPRQGGWGSEGW